VLDNLSVHIMSILVIDLGGECEAGKPTVNKEVRYGKRFNEMGTVE
jgi:hypothetical protein